MLFNANPMMSGRAMTMAFVHCQLAQAMLAVALWIVVSVAALAAVAMEHSQPALAMLQVQVELPAYSAVP